MCNESIFINNIPKRSLFIIYNYEQFNTQQHENESIDRRAKLINWIRNTETGRLQFNET